MSIMNVNDYLKRIKLPSSRTGDAFEDLKKMQIQHLYHVPFENLDVVNKVPIELDLTRIYKKIVLNQRGGFCYEINGLFHWLLKQLGYEVKMISSTIAKDKNHWYKENTHLTSIVTIENVEYLVEVGAGDTVRTPIPLNGEIVEDISGRYRIDSDGDLLQLQKYVDHEWIPVYRFTTTPKAYSFFEEVCKWNQTSPESHFTQKMITTMANETGRVTLTNQEIITTINGKKTKREYSPNELSELLIDLFGMDIPIIGQSELNSSI
ncbi:arylamine N-acetyltransferase family protein [Chengkuizengella axinellae]|uniref:Arylamine N-acetyltransferase n=1 Tax=Chengkuizengella axinellae TaxID=3064388 RepID=A0ABT9IZK8_9BACL|nr:arylamine N-acetyltransferase [Chengkuizengella sp. 2205SS18-9]MDP5274767.1 arylamine N-acetyltransferase [Chengkuizengella sp. 2205SS18-9]